MAGGAVIVAALATGAGLASFGPIVRARLEQQAAARGLAVEVAGVRPGLGRVWLRSVRVRIPEVPSVTVLLDEVEVSLSAGLGVRSVAAHGGTIEIDGTLERVEAELRAWRAARPKGADGGPSSRSYSADGLRLVWRGAAAAAPDQHAWGLRYERDASGAEHVGADLVRLKYRGISVELAGPTVELASGEAGRVVSRVAATSVTGRVDLGLVGLDAVRPPTAVAGPGAAASSSPPAEPRGKGAATSATAPGAALRHQLDRVAHAVAEVLPSGGALELSQLRLEVASADEVLTVGPARLAVAREAQRVKLELVPGKSEAETPLELRLDVPLTKGDVVIELSGGPVSLKTLGIAEHSFGLLDVAKTAVSAKGRLVIDEGGANLAFAGKADIEHLNLDSPRIAATPMRDISLGWRGRGELAGDLQRLELAESELRVGKARVAVTGEVAWKDGKLERGDLQGGVPLASCQSMLSSAPAALLPLLGGVTLDGTFALDVTAAFDFSKRAEPKVTWKMANDCRVGAVPPELDPARFATTWRREVLGADGRPVTVESGPGTPTWVPLASISPHMPTAILICEDARFYRHAGFDQEAIANSIRANIQAREFLRGASTVSMQLAKNLYLARDKTASRKLQEAVLTVLLEQSLSKDQLMELYLNVIEFGPGIYGIGPAAAYYFSSTASELSLGQSLYLASILPNPRSHHFGPGGEVTEKWLAYLHKLMHVAHKIQRISDEELAAGLDEVIAFQKPYQPPEVAPAGGGGEEADAASFPGPLPAPSPP